jgi:hypothetical protein
MKISRLKSLVRPLLITTFLIVVWIDFVILPLIDTFNGREHSPYTTPEFWLGFSAIVAFYVHSRTKEKIAGVEPEKP